jgi:hypothetical protein
MTQICYTARCKPWSNEPAASHQVMIDTMDAAPIRVRVWDGRIYTLCHSLTPRSEKAIIRKALALAAAR